MIEDLLKLFETIIKPRFKIAIISYYYPYQKPSTSGVGTHVYNLVTTLAKLGCEVHVFSYSEKDSIKKIKVGNGKIILHFINSNFKFAVSNPIIEKRVKYAIFENKILNEFIYEHSRRPFKIIHTHGWLTSSAFMLKHLYNIPWVHTIHALERNRLTHMTEEEKQLYRLTSWIEDTLSDADQLICVSKSVQKEVLKSFNNISKKTIVIPNAVDLKIFVPGENKSRTVLTISRFSKEKGSFLLPEIIENVLSKTKDSKFIAIIQNTNLPGLLEIQEKLTELVKKYPERFIWVSKPIYAKDIVNYYMDSSIYIQPSLYESFGLCILEAMACGNAIVATDRGGIPEATGTSAILVKPDSDELSKEIIRLLKNESLLKKYQKLSIQQSRLFDWKIIGKNVLDLYMKLSNEPNNLNLKK